MIIFTPMQKKPGFEIKNVAPSETSPTLVAPAIICLHAVRLRGGCCPNAGCTSHEGIGWQGRSIPGPYGKLSRQKLKHRISRRGSKSDGALYIISAFASK